MQHTKQPREHGSILRMLGVDVWRLRAAVARPAQPAPPAQEADDVRETTVDFPSPGEGPVGSVTGSAELPPVDVVQPPAMPAVAAQTVAEPFCVLCLQAGSALLLLETGDLKRARRLGADILASCKATWPIEFSETVFTWPQGVLPGTSGSGNRALGAFISRQVDELGVASTVLVCERVQARLPQMVAGMVSGAGRVVVVPAFSRLLVDEAAKRDLWRRIQTPAS